MRKNCAAPMSNNPGRTFTPLVHHYPHRYPQILGITVTAQRRLPLGKKKKSIRPCRERWQKKPSYERHETIRQRRLLCQTRPSIPTPISSRVAGSGTAPTSPTRTAHADVLKSLTPSS